MNNPDNQWLKKEQHEQISAFEIVRGSEAPLENRESPFYNSYHWAMADWDDKKLYLPDTCDEATAFALAAHELGHLVERGRLQPDRHDFETTYREELRAWAQGWKYLAAHLGEYYDGDEAMIEKVFRAKEKIEAILLEMTEATKPFYAEAGETGNDQRKDFLSTEAGAALKKRIDNLKTEVHAAMNDAGLSELLQPIEWERYAAVVRKALADIEADNQAESDETNN